jgi:hypothetical protein
MVKTKSSCCARKQFLPPEKRKKKRKRKKGKYSHLLRWPDWAVKVFEKNTT